MHAVRFQASSLMEAEELVSRVWRLLEGKNIATPKLLVTDGEAGTTIELLFASLTHANLIAEVVRGTATREPAI
jgi:hypothetical protein